MCNIIFRVINIFTNCLFKANKRMNKEKLAARLEHAAEIIKSVYR